MCLHRLVFLQLRTSLCLRLSDALRSASDPSNSSNLPSLDQSCGGWYDNATYQNRGFLLVSDLDGLEREVPKGFICPPGQMCVEESDNLTPGMSFDNVLSGECGSLGSNCLSVIS